MPANWYASEYGCEFVDTIDQVFSHEHVMGALSDEVEPLFFPILTDHGALDRSITPFGGIQSYYFAGLDLGQSQDYTALAIAERIVPLEGKASYNFRYLERLKLGIPYPDQITHVKETLERPPLKGNVTLALDYTGVGRPVADMFKHARIQCALYTVGIHGGDKVLWDEEDKYLVKVPKRDLVAVVQVLLQSGRLKIAEALPEAKTLVKELLNFKVKIDPATAHDSYSAWRENMHDDFVLAVALACWIGEQKGGATTDYQTVVPGRMSGLFGHNRGAY